MVGYTEFREMVAKIVAANWAYLTNEDISREEMIRLLATYMHDELEARHMLRGADNVD